MFEVILASRARQFYDDADRPLAAKLNRCFDRLSTNPRSGNNVKRLSADLDRYYRYRVGDWRVIYRIDDEAQKVFVVDVAHRSEAYE